MYELAVAMPLTLKDLKHQDYPVQKVYQYWLTHIDTCFQELRQMTSDQLNIIFQKLNVYALSVQNSQDQEAKQNMKSCLKTFRLALFLRQYRDQNKNKKIQEIKNYVLSIQKLQNKLLEHHIHSQKEVRFNYLHSKVTKLRLQMITIINELPKIQSISQQDILIQKGYSNCDQALEIIKQLLNKGYLAQRKEHIVWIIMEIISTLLTYLNLLFLITNISDYEYQRLMWSFAGVFTALKYMVHQKMIKRLFNKVKNYFHFLTPMHVFVGIAICDT